jgi:hypothetical protein
MSLGFAAYAMLDWLQRYSVLLSGLGIASFLIFVCSVMVIPWLLVQIPADYFLRPQHYVDRLLPRHRLLRMMLLVLKNLVGLLLIAIGLAMLVLPGQGILTVVVGMLFLDFPGKRAIELRVVRQRRVLHAINWIRTKASRPPLQLPR